MMAANVLKGVISLHDRSWLCAYRSSMMRDSLRTSRLAGLGASSFFFTFFESFLFRPFWFSTPGRCGIARVAPSVVHVARVIQHNQEAREGEGLLTCEPCEPCSYSLYRSLSRKRGKQSVSRRLKIECWILLNTSGFAPANDASNCRFWSFVMLICHPMFVFVRCR